MKLSERALALKPSPTLALAAKAKELSSQGKDVISLSVGEPDWPTFPVVAEAGIQAIQEGLTKYTPANGVPELRKAISDLTNTQLKTNYGPQQVTVTAGAKFIVFGALQVLVEKGDEVLIPAPYWVSYPTMVELADAKPIIIPTQERNRFIMTGEELARAITPKTKALILTSPSNPTGEYYNQDELKSLAEVLRKHPQVAILSDDIYNRLVFGKETAAPHLLEVAPDLKERVVVINGASKSYSMTGWRLGWALGPQNVIDAMTNYQSQSVSCAPAMVQKAGLVALQKAESDLQKSVSVLKERRDEAHKALSKIPGLTVSSPGGAFYLWPKISACFGKSYEGTRINTSSDFCKLLLEHQLVAAVPGVEFGAEGYMRISYVVSPARCLEAIQRIGQFVSRLN